MASKGPEAFRTISEVAQELDLPQHVLRFWETRFTQIRPMKRGGGRRYYRPEDVELLRGIRTLLYGEGYTIRGVQRLLKEQGPRYVLAVGRGEVASAAETDREDDDGEDMAPSPALRREPPRIAVARGDESGDALSPEDDDDGEEDAPSGEQRRAGEERLANAGRDGAATAGEEYPDDGGDEDAAEETAADDADMPAPVFNPREFRTAGATRSPSPGPGAQERAGGLSRRDVRLLQETLTHLLEMKRKLDQARGI